MSKLTLPVLYRLSLQGKIREWRVSAVDGYVEVSYNSENGESTTTVTECEETNIGKSNYRSHNEQAIFEARSLWAAKRKLGYVEDPKDVVKIVMLPMLAKVFDSRIHKPPFDVQYKYNGMRALCIIEDGVARFISRTGTPLNLPRLVAAIKHPANGVLDGELYRHKAPLQKIISEVKLGDDSNLEYIIYDMPSKDPWSDRRVLLESLPAMDKCRIAPTITVSSMEGLNEIEVRALNDGYEGLIIRQRDLLYTFNKRTSALLKLKRFQDAEFKIVGVESRYEPSIGDICCALEVCNNLTNATFKCNLLGDWTYKKYIYDNQREFIGRVATVKFLERSIDLIPIGNPVCVAIDDSK